MSHDPEHFASDASPVARRDSPAERRAVIDIGTNSVKLLVADVTATSVIPVWEGSEQTRLGRGFYDDHQLRPEAIADTAQATARFAATAREHGATHLRLIATSAARDARNADQLRSAIHAATGQPLEVISGEQEADWAFQGVLTHSPLGPQPVLILDIGGGSTEIILGHAGRTLFRDSFKLGTVRLLEAAPLADPPTSAELSRLREQLRAFLRSEVLPRLTPHLAAAGTAWLSTIPPTQPIQLVGTGGTTSILARMELQLADYERDRMEATRLSRERIRWHLEHLASLPLAERRALPGLPSKRADVILLGAAILEAVMDTLQLTELRISTRGLRFAAVRP
jgi:exopolyphosphatase/guanosine-5'-triphosphate,3'-diphosphate pyrophosphatase